jgi:hypothetical protein
VTCAADRVELLVAAWVLDRLASEEVPDLAGGAVAEGCRAPTAAVLAGLDKPDRYDVEQHLPALLGEIGLNPPTRDEALKLLVDETAGAIVCGELAAVAGASRIWALWGYGREPDPRSMIWEDVRPFVALAMEYEIAGSAAWRKDAAIVAAARALLERGGLHIAT